MDVSKIKTQIVNTNYRTMRFVSLIALGFAIFVLMTDFLFHSVVWQQYLFFYRILDIAFSIIAVTAVCFFWLFKTKSIALLHIGTIIFPFLSLIWSAIVTGIDFQLFGLTTFVTVLLLCTFFLYLNPVSSVIFVLCSCCVLLITIYMDGKLNEHILPLVFLLIPIIVFSVLMTIRNYKNKLIDIENQDKIVEMNKNLLYANENLEMEVENRTKALQIAKEKAEESNQLKTAFLQNMSHEVRTPLNAIIGFTQLITEPNQPPEKLAKYAEIINESSDRLIGIITDVIEVSKIQSKQMAIRQKKFDIVSTLNQVVANFETAANGKNIGLELNVKIPVKEYFVFSDKEKFERIFIHLIDNAIKFTHQGKVVITIEIVLKSIHISISDTGIGISEETKSIIFEPFRQIDNGIDRSFGGNGLGLAIVKAYIEMLNGQITVTSELNKGSIFCVKLPANEQAQKNELQPKTKRNDFAGITVLVAEDDLSNYMVLETLLKRVNVKVIHAHNGQEAIDFCSNNPEIDLVLMDIQMPVMDGCSATQQIKSFRAELPVIAQTAYATEVDRETFSGCGFDEYIKKPIDLDLLLATVNRLIK